MKIRVADYIVEFLESHGVEKVFLLSGGGMMHMIDAIGRAKKLTYVCNHHEHACALGAEGYARKNNSLGACFATSGPGATNTVTGVVECWQDSVPVLFFSGQSKLSQTIRGSGKHTLRQFGTFEVDIIPIVESVTKYAAFLDDPKKIRYHLEKAAFLASSGRPGPAFIDIPVDLQGAFIDPSTLESFNPEKEGCLNDELSFTERDSLQILEKIRRAKKPLILAGHGVRCAESAEDFRSLVKALGIPVVTTPLAADLMTYQDTKYIGHPGMKGDRAGNFSVQSADLIISLGCSLHVTTTGYELDKFAPGAYKIQVDLDSAILERQQVGVNQQIKCGVSQFIKIMSAAAKNSDDFPLKGTVIETWLSKCLLWKEKLAVQREPHKHEGSQINIYDLNDALSDLSSEGDTIVADSGSSFYVVGQAFRTKEKQRILISGALGAMGHAVPVGIGACEADKDHRVIVVIGDGSFQTNIQELATVAKTKCNMKMFVINNNGYVSIRNTQTNFFGGFFVGTSESSGVLLPDLNKIAESYGIPYVKIESINDLRTGVESVLNSSGPIICEVMTPSNQEIIPTVSSFKQADGSMISKPLHDMYPFMDEETFNKYMN